MRVCPSVQPSWTNDNVNKAFSEAEVKEQSNKIDNGVEVIDDLNSDGSDTDDTSSVSTSDSRQVCLVHLLCETLHLNWGIISLMLYSLIH